MLFNHDSPTKLDKAPTKECIAQVRDMETSLILNLCLLLFLVTKQHKEDCKQLFRLMRVLVIELVQDPSKHNDVESLSRVEDGTLDQHQHPQDPEAFLEEEDYSIERHHQLPLNNPNLKSTPSLSGQLVFL
ncbi:hypothetical protein Tco_1205283 [Tanacetum coccineum]